ncbi:MAG TPA: hypothetical protein VG796_13020 [Verrucomicrobiales bacterium]|nr:hypothetical protein [Verrucomicrobiales bacterium]
MSRRLLSFLAAAACATVLSSCQAPSAGNLTTGAARDRPFGYSDAAVTPEVRGKRVPSPMMPCSPPADRKGLATGWDKRLDDKVTTTIFPREPGKPVGVAKIYYNDLEGARAMAGGNYSYSNSFRDYAGGVFRVGMRNHRGAALSAYQSGGNLICIGEDGQRYAVEVENLSNHRLEFVVTVDGLDVLSGQPGSFSRRGYVLSPGERREIKGWRTSVNEVAAFKFGKVADAYVNKKTGETANVGVVGAAVFAERGTTPKPYAGTDAYRRLNADPFVVEGTGFAPPPSH